MLPPIISHHLLIIQFQKLYKKLRNIGKFWVKKLRNMGNFWDKKLPNIGNFEYKKLRNIGDFEKKLRNIGNFWAINLVTLVTFNTTLVTCLLDPLHSTSTHLIFFLLTYF